MQNSIYETDILEINKQIEGSIHLIRTTSEEESQRMLKENLADGFITVSYLALEFVKNNPDYIA